jgi:hypothetical protein
MPNIFEPEIATIRVACSQCGTALEMASSALSVFESQDAVRCMDCLLAESIPAGTDPTVTISDRIHLIDEAVDDFAAHLRNVLVRCVKPDLTWNSEYGMDEWSDPLDLVAAAYAPGVWYALQRQSKNADQQ